MEDMANWENMILHSWHIKRTQLHIHSFNILRIRPIEERKNNYTHIYMNGIWGHWTLQENTSEIEEEKTVFEVFPFSSKY